MPATSPVTPFVVTRTFDAPRARVWQAFTEPERLKAWWGPKVSRVACGKWTCVRAAVPLRDEVPDGSLMWAKCAYREIAAPERIVFVNCFSTRTARRAQPDGAGLAAGGALRVPLPEGRTVHAGVDPARRHRGRMRIVRQLPRRHGDGWEGTFEQLDAYLATGGDGVLTPAG